MALNEPETGLEGSIRDIHARLLLWGRQRRRGLARVEFSSEFARQRVMDQLTRDLRELDIPIHEIELPKWSPPAHIIQYLLETLENIESGIVSINGFATAFDQTLSLTDALRVINFNRENLVKPQLSQIWWMTRSFTDKALHAMPDLNSWFKLRLFLTESIRPDDSGFKMPEWIEPRESLIWVESDGNPTIIHNLPREASHQFVGREAELTRLHSALQHPQPIAVSAIMGMGGVGKTELALQYATQYQTSYPGGICWLRARDIDIGAQVIAFAQDKLGLSPPSEGERLEQTHWCWEHWPGPNQTVLLVLDDVNDYEQVARYLPRTGRFKILITTRLVSLGESVHTLNLDLLPADAAQTLLAMLIGVERWQAESAIGQALCAWLGYLPLGIELLGHYLQYHPELSLEDCYQRLQVRQADYAVVRQLPPGVEAQLPLMVVFDNTWQFLSNRAQQLACLLSCFALAPIPWSLVEDCRLEPKTVDLAEIRDSELIAMSLLGQAGDNLYQLHPLIAQFLGIQREQTDWANDLKRTFCQAMAKIAATIPLTPVRTQILELTPTIPHLVEAATTWQNWLTDGNLVWPFIGLGRFYAGQGAYSAAEPWYVMCLDVTQNRLGDRHPDVAASFNNLAGLYRSQGRYEEAEPFYLKALAMRQDLLGDRHPDVATSLNNLAGLYESQGRYEEAEPLYLQDLEMSRELLGDRHPDVATSLNNLAGLYRSQGRYEEAEPLYLKALAMRQDLLGDRHPDVATSLNNLAGLYESQGRYEEAEPLYQQALAMMQDLLGDRHPDVATSLNNLANLYQSQGRYEDAEPFYLQALEMSRELLGDRHPAVATSLNNLASLYELQGRYEDAEPLYQQALAMMQNLLGDRHPAVATSLNNLASLYESQGRYEEAEPLYQQALAMMQDLLGDRHPDVATSLNNLALLYESQGRYEDAKPLYLQALAMRQDLLGDRHPAVATSLNNLAGLYRSQGRYGESEPFYLKAIAIGLQVLGEDHPDVATWCSNLAGLYTATERFAEAEPLYLQALNIFVQRLEQEHPRVNQVIDDLLNFVQAAIAAGQEAVLSDHPLIQAIAAGQETMLSDDPMIQAIVKQIKDG